VTLAGFVMLWAHPALGVIMFVQVVRHATHHAIDRPTREILYTAVGADARYKSKSFIDTFVYRAGDVGGTWTPTAIKAMGLVVSPFAIAAAFAWAGIGVALGVMNRKRRMAVGAEGRKPPEGTPVGA
jgi:AAA family ATP:ADP antiporter